MERPLDKSAIAKEFLVSGDNKKEKEMGGTSLGWYDVDIKTLPSKGLFYPEGASMEIKAITVPEIKKFSSLDDNNILSINNAIKRVVKNFVRIKIEDNYYNGLYLVEADKVCSLFMIRDLSIKKEGQENKMFTSSKCPNCGSPSKKELDHSVFSFFKIAGSVMKWYDSNTRSFQINHPSFEAPLSVYVPTVGVIDGITSFMVEKEKEKRSGDGGGYNQDHINLVQFLLPNHVGVNRNTIEKCLKGIATMSANKYAVLKEMERRLSGSISPTVDMICQSKGDCQGEVWQAPIRFRFSTLFDLQDIIGDIFQD